MNWIILILAAGFEVVLVISLSKSNSFKNIKMTIIAIVAQILSLFLLSQAVKTLPLNVAYAIWTGLGATGSIAYGVVTKQEQMNCKKLLMLTMLLSGILLLKISGN